MIDHLRDGFGVDPVCRVLQLSPSTYFARKQRPKSARQLRDEELIPLATAVWEDSGRTYGARRVTRALARAGHRRADAPGRHCARSASRASSADSAAAPRSTSRPPRVRRTWSTVGSPPSRAWAISRGLTDLSASAARAAGRLGTCHRKGESMVGLSTDSATLTIRPRSKPSMSARNSGLDRYASIRSCTSSASW